MKYIKAFKLANDFHYQKTSPFKSRQCELYVKSVTLRAYKQQLEDRHPQYKVYQYEESRLIGIVTYNRNEIP